jgi:hypothetical protein
MLLAALMAVYLLVLKLLSQGSDEAMNLLLHIGGAVLLFLGFPRAGSRDRDAWSACWVWRWCWRGHHSMKGREVFPR